MENKKEALVSIIIPAYNEERYIKDTLLHVQKQSYKNKEITVVVDGGTDKTLDIAKRYANKVIKLKKRGGVSYARNRGAKIAKGKFLLFLDADTLLWDKNCIKNIMSKINTNRSYYGTCRMKAEKLSCMPYCTLKNILIKYTPLKASNGIIFIKKRIHNRIGGFNEKKDKEEIFEYFKKAGKYGKFKFVNSEVMPSMRRGCIKTIAYWAAIKTGLARKNPYTIVR
jgi:cellulose synthase/poly-beta-1,6-N-acetylglucosamine synthase-like glycosyltransferase